MYPNAIFALLAFGAAVSAQVAVYGQCGGENYSGSTQCAAGSTCVYSNPYYSQCLPPSSSSSTLSSSTTASGSASSATLYGQCGGSGYTGPTQCPPGTTCQYNNAYYSQCLYPSSSSSSASNGGSSGNPPASSSSSSPASSTGSSSGSNPTYKASMTHYGSGDQNGSPNCNTNTAACGFYTQPGYSAAISQNFYGAGPGQGAGPACGTCWRLTGETDSSGNALSNAGTTIVVMINNLCPADGNPLCAQNGQSGTNQYGANINFDLCSDSGASGAFFGNDGEGLAVGYATEVDCSQWSGTVQH